MQLQGRLDVKIFSNNHRATSRPYFLLRYTQCSERPAGSKTQISPSSLDSASITCTSETFLIHELLSVSRPDLAVLSSHQRLVLSLKTERRSLLFMKPAAIVSLGDWSSPRSLVRDTNGRRGFGDGGSQPRSLGDYPGFHARDKLIFQSGGNERRKEKWGEDIYCSGAMQPLLS